MQRHPDRDEGESPQLAIYYEATQDNSDGSPWPPDGADFWSVVTRANGSTTWRRIGITLRVRP
jgi:hypothetical protein